MMIAARWLQAVGYFVALARPADVDQVLKLWEVQREYFFWLHSKRLQRVMSIPLQIWAAENCSMVRGTLRRLTVCGTLHTRRKPTGMLFCQNAKRGVESLYVFSRTNTIAQDSAPA